MNITKIISSLFIAGLGLACVHSYAALKPLDDAQLEKVSGSGIGLVVEDLAISSAQKGQPDAFEIDLLLSEDPNAPMKLTISGLNLYKSGTQSGGRIGSYEHPLITGELRKVSENVTRSIDPEGDGTFVNAKRNHTAFYTALPGAAENQLEKSFYGFTKLAGNDLGVPNTVAKGAYRDGYSTYSKGLPNDFFSNKNTVNVGNLQTLKNKQNRAISEQNARMDTYADKFDLSLRLDTTYINAGTVEDLFIANVQLKGFRLYKTSGIIWSHNRQNERAVNTTGYNNNGQPVTGSRGLSFAFRNGFMADSLILNTDKSNSLASQIEFKGIDVYLPMGSIDQPVSITTVKHSQIKRGTWGDNPVMMPAKNQLRLEIAGLPQALGQAEQGHIFVQSIEFGDKNDPEVIVGRKDVHLRDASGNKVTTISNVPHRAFVPETVIYNEQVAKYNAANPNNTIPTIPNQNVIEVRGLEVQRLVVTTQDL